MYREIYLSFFFFLTDHTYRARIEIPFGKCLSLCRSKAGLFPIISGHQEAPQRHTPLFFLLNFNQLKQISRAQAIHSSVLSQGRCFRDWGFLIESRPCGQNHTTRRNGCPSLGGGGTANEWPEEKAIERVREHQQHLLGPGPARNSPASRERLKQKSPYGNHQQVRAGDLAQWVMFVRDKSAEQRVAPVMERQTWELPIISTLGEDPSTNRHNLELVSSQFTERPCLLT